MHWLYLVVGIVMMVVASLKVTPTWLMVLLVLGALGMFLAWMFGLMASRVGLASRDEVQLLSPDELRHLREQAEARKAAASAPPAADDEAR